MRLAALTIQNDNNPEEASSVLSLGFAGMQLADGARTRPEEREEFQCVHSAAPTSAMCPIYLGDFQ